MSRRFFFQAEDGIRDGHVTGVQTCALPISSGTTGRRWYLMAYDVDRADWRTFRLDRTRDVSATTWRFQPRNHPDPVTCVHQAVTAAPYRHHARGRLRAPAEQARAAPTSTRRNASH